MISRERQKVLVAEAFTLAGRFLILDAERMDASDDHNEEEDTYVRAILLKIGLGLQARGKMTL